MITFIFSSSTSFRAINNVFPIFCPFLSPLEMPKASRIIFCQFDFHFWFADLNLVFWLVNRCFDFLPATLFLHILKEDDFKFERINWITSFSLRLNWKSIASKGVLSSHAISMMRSTSAELSFLCIIFFFKFFTNLKGIFKEIGTYIPHIIFWTTKTNCNRFVLALWNELFVLALRIDFCYDSKCW